MTIDVWMQHPTQRFLRNDMLAAVQRFCTQVGHTGPLRPSETGRPIPYIDQVALDFPELVIGCGYVGYPCTEEMVAHGYALDGLDDLELRDDARCDYSPASGRCPRHGNAERVFRLADKARP